MAGKTLQVLLVDDDPSCREDLRQSLSAFPYISVAGEADSAASAIMQMQTKQIDLAFLDIELGTDSGFQLARHIHRAYPACLVIFLTGHVDFALEGYEYGPVDFLVKPTNLMRLEQALLQVRGRLEPYGGQPAAEDDCIGIQSGSRLEIVQVQKILYLEKKGWKVLLVCEDGETISTRESLQTLEPTFLPRGFYRCHQSFLVPLRRIRSVQLDGSHTYSLYLEGLETPIPLSRNRYGELRQLLSERGLAIY